MIKDDDWFDAVGKYEWQETRELKEQEKQINDNKEKQNEQN